MNRSKAGEFLGQVKLKKSKLTNRDTINFIENKWSQADNKKYKIYDGTTPITRMINEYIGLKDFKNMERWLHMDDLHDDSKKIRTTYEIITGGGVLPGVRQ